MTQHRIAAVALSAGLLFTALPQPAFAASDTMEEFTELLLNAWENLDEEVDVHSLGLTRAECQDAYFSILYQHGEYFYVDSGYRISMNGEGEVLSLMVSYSYDLEDIPAMKSTFDSRVARVAAACSPEWSEAEKALYLHDYLAETCSYDLTYDRHNAYNALIEGSAVCQGYSLALSALCNAVGLKTYAATSETLNHMWNVIRIDGEWYQIDVTFDDTVPDRLGHVEHSYFLRDDVYMYEDAAHHADDWYCYSGDDEISCDSTRFSDGFWTEVSDTVESMDGDIIYAKGNPNPAYVSDIYTDIMRVRPGEDPEQLLHLDAKWSTAQGYYTQGFVNAEVYGDKLYYNDSESIYLLSPDTGETSVFYTLTDSEKEIGLIYGMCIREGGLLEYQLMASPYSDPTIHSIQLTPVEPPVLEMTTTATETTTEETATETTTMMTTMMTTIPEKTTEAATSTAEIEETTAETTTTPEETTTTTTESMLSTQQMKRGDVDGNGNINIADAVVISRLSTGDETLKLNYRQIMNANCNGDSRIDAEDTVTILNYLTGIIDKF